jgi:hypothetical protein
MSEFNPQADQQADPEKLLMKLIELVKLSPDVRFGQLLANLGFLAEARAGQSLWDIEDPRLLQIMEQHRDELVQRLQPSLTRQSKR